MHFRIIEVKTDEQIEEMMASFWRGLNNPRNVLRELVFPVKGDGHEAVENAIEDCKDRFLQGLHSNPVGHYIQVLDSDNNDTVVAAALWNFFDKDHNPFLNATAREPAWWPKDSEIWKYTKMADEQGLIPRLIRQQRPHACKPLLNQLHCLC